MILTHDMRTHTSADAIYTHGNLITLDPRRPRATCMAVRADGRIAAVGNDDDDGREVAAALPPDTPRFDLAGKTVTPGFIDSHVHLLSYGLQLLNEADLVGSASVDDILSRLAALAGGKGDGWLVGVGFDQEKLAERRFPTRGDLNRVSSTRPVMIWRICGHAAVVNSAALTLVPEAERRAGDEQSGLYTEDDAMPFYRRIPPPGEDEMERAALAACEVALRSGITSVHTLLDTPRQMIAWSRLRRRTGRLPIRVTGMPPYSAVAQLHAHGINTTFGDEWLNVGAAKLFSDGSLGAQTALLAEPYADKPDTRGIRIYDPADLKAKAADAQAKGFQLAIHAIGDQAVRETLDAIEHALGGGSNEVHRHRVEHASVTPPDCLERMARLKIVATLQPQFVTSDTWTAQRLGPARTPWAYPFRTFLDAGVPVTLSSDCPVERMDAFAAIASAVGRASWSAPGQTLRPEEAIRAYTLGSASLADRDHDVGSIEVGKLADFVVLSDDPTDLNADAIRSLRAEAVFVGGVPNGARATRP
jgi:predicted amidohydrolase YtcJ